MAAKFITITLKGQAQARRTAQDLASRMRLIVVKPTLEWLEEELTGAFKKVIGPSSPVFYRGDTELRLWDGLSSTVGGDKLTFYEGSPHGGFVRRGTRGYHGGGRAGGYKRLKTWAQSKVGDPSAASRIAWFTLMRGTRSSKSARYPPGLPQYDYPRKVVEVDGKPALERTADYMGKILVSYVKSKQAGMR